MSVVVWTERFVPDVGGLEKSTYRLCKALANAGIRVEVVTSQPAVSVLPGVESDVVSGPHFLADSFEAIRKRLPTASLLYLPRLVQGQEAEHIYLLGELHCTERGVPVFLRVPTTEAVRRMRYCDRNGTIKKCVEVLLVQNARSAHLCRALFPDVATLMSRNTTDIPAAYSQNYHSYFIYAGRITASKNLITLIDGYRLYQTRYHATSIPLRVYGVDYSRRYFGRCMEAVRRVPNACYCGSYPMLSTSQVDGAYFAVIPSYREGHCNVLLESLATGTPVVASAIPGLQEDLHPDWSIPIGNQSSPLSIADALEAAHVVTRARYEEMCKGARGYVVREYSGVEEQVRATRSRVVERLASSDCAIVVCKPEALHRADAVGNSLKKRGYQIVARRRTNGWAAFVDRFYDALSASQKQVYVAAGKRNGWTDQYEAFLIRHVEGDTLERVTAEKGAPDSYQRHRDTTLRAEFGRPRQFNLVWGEEEIVFNGIHATRSVAEFASAVFFLEWDGLLLAGTRHEAK